jgi:opacity protein-like surface antigen
MTESRFPRGSRSAVLILILMIAALAAVPPAFSQAVAPNPTTVDLFGGGSYNEAFTPSNHEYGWDASVTERPYFTHPWVGGTIEASGAYSSTAAHGSTPAISNQFYTAMGGPAFVLNANHIQPFARVLLGTGLQRVSGGASITTNTAHFAFSAGGGVDVAFSRSWALRGQADLIRTYVSTANVTNMLRASVGLDFRF